MIDPKSENWAKNGNVYDISNEISIPKHGSAYENRFIGTNMKTYALLCIYTGMKPEPEYDRYASPLSSEQFKDLEPSMPYRKSIEIPNSNLYESRSCSEDKSKDYMKIENENFNGNWIAIHLNDPNIEEKLDMKHIKTCMDHLIINGALKENNHGKLDYSLNKRRSFDDIIGNPENDYEEVFEENAKLDENKENMEP